MRLFKPRRQGKKQSYDAGFVVYAFFIALSFIVMLIPLALYHFAQISALSGKKRAVTLLLGVILCLWLLGFLTGSFFIISGALVGLLASPFFIVGTDARRKHNPVLRTALAFLLPTVLILVLFVFVMPQKNPLELDFLIQQQKIGDAAVQAAFDQQIALMRESSAFLTFQDVIGYHPLQRLSWLVYGPGSSFLLSLLLMSFLSLVFLDFSFEQIERLKGICRYVVQYPERFSSDVSFQMSEFPLFKALLGNEFVQAAEVSGNRKLPELSDNISLLEKVRMFFLKPDKSSHDTLFNGYIFKTSNASNWNLRNFSTNLPLVLVSIIFFVVMILLFPEQNMLIAASAPGNSLVAFPFLSYIIGPFGIMAFTILVVLAIQGLLTMYLRLSNLVLIVILIAAWISGSEVSFGPYLLIAIFGAVGLWDELYDWRHIRKTV